MIDFFRGRIYNMSEQKVFVHSGVFELKTNYQLGESKEVEYKQEYSKTLLKTVAAFANYNDGVIVVGINDKGEATGVSNVNFLKEQIENAIYDSILPNPYFEIETGVYGGKTVLVIKVYKSENTPYTYKGKAYKRVAITTREVDLYEYNELKLRTLILTMHLENSISGSN
jgi:ATP-dependent DNA helicase RecG